MGGGIINNGETITIGWCDSGMVEGKFADGLMSVTLGGPSIGFPISSSMRVKGNQISRQRQDLVDYWYSTVKSDWLFWVDSDIVLNLDIWHKMCSLADKENYPMVTGVYFIAKEEDGSLPVVYPSIYDDVDNFTIKNHHPLPENQILKVDCAGMGLVIMHRDVITKLQEKYGTTVSLFAENDQKSDKFVGEDISFFRKCKEAGIPLYAHTGAIAKHHKKVDWDMDYYNLYWNAVSQYLSN